ncbi:MAG: methyltransferase domain-containing protein, partial [Bacteroidales bacterium]
MKASFSYNKQAVAQKQIVGQLMHKMARFIPVQIHSALEIGCGSGLLTNLFLQHFSAKKLILNDLLPIQEPLREILGSRDFCFREEDAENLELNEKVDLIFSSSTFQWFVNQDHFFKRCAGLLNKQGILAFSSFVPGNLSEIKELTGVGLNYRKKEELIASLKEHFDILDISDKTIKMNFDSPRAVLRHLS